MYLSFGILHIPVSIHAKPWWVKESPFQNKQFQDKLCFRPNNVVLILSLLYVTKLGTIFYNSLDFNHHDVKILKRKSSKNFHLLIMKWNYFRKWIRKKNLQFYSPICLLIRQSLIANLFLKWIDSIYKWQMPKACAWFSKLRSQSRFRSSLKIEIAIEIPIAILKKDWRSRSWLWLYDRRSFSDLFT